MAGGEALRMLQDRVVDKSLGVGAFLAGLLVGAAANPTLNPKNKEMIDNQLFEYRSVRYWSQETNGTLPGGRKNFFLIRDY